MADFCTVCHMLDQVLMDKISNTLKFFSIGLADQLHLDLPYFGDRKTERSRTTGLIRGFCYS